MRGWKRCFHEKGMDAKHVIARACTQSPWHVNFADCRAPNCLSREGAFNICQLQ